MDSIKEILKNPKTRKNKNKKKGGGRPERVLEIQLFKLAVNMDENGDQIYSEIKQTQMALSILEKGIDINAKHDEDEMYDIMEEKNITSCEEEEWIKPKFTALHYACYYNESNMVHLLIGEGATIHIMDERGKTPLHIACEKGNINIIKTLLEYGANINFGIDVSEGIKKKTKKMGRRRRGPRTEIFELYETPLHSAISSDDNIDKKMEVVTTLVDRDANINAIDHNGYTPLNLAVFIADEDDAVLNSVVLYLIEKGADVNISDKEGSTPLHHAIDCRNANLAIALIDNGADYDAKNNKGKTAIQGYDVRIDEADDADRAEFLEWRQGIINHIRNLPKSQERRTMLSLGIRDPKSPLSKLGKDPISIINKFVIGGKRKTKKRFKRKISKKKSKHYQKLIYNKTLRK